MHAQAAHTMQLVQGAAACTVLSMYHTRFHVDCYIAAGWFYKASNGFCSSNTPQCCCVHDPSV